jgi:hypothetical protein
VLGPVISNIAPPVLNLRALTLSMVDRLPS